MTYLIIKQIEVEADSIEEAISKIEQGEVINLSVQSRRNPQMAAVGPAGKPQSPNKK